MLRLGLEAAHSRGEAAHARFAGRVSLPSFIFFGLFLPRLSLFLAHQAAFLGASLFFSLLLLLLYYLFLILELYTEGRAQQRITA